MLRSRRDDNVLYRLSKPPKLPESGGVLRLRAGEELPPAFGATVKRSGRQVQIWIESYHAFKAAAWKLLPFLVNPFRGYIQVPGIWMPDFQLWDMCSSGEPRCHGRVFVYWIEGDVAHGVCVKHLVTVDFPQEALDSRMGYREAWYLFKMKTLNALLAPARQE